MTLKQTGSEYTGNLLMTSISTAGATPSGPLKGWCRGNQVRVIGPSNLTGSLTVQGDSMTAPCSYDLLIRTNTVCTWRTSRSRGRNSALYLGQESLHQDESKVCRMLYEVHRLAFWLHDNCVSVCCWNVLTSLAKT
jgi:hypothetical protein